MSKYILILRRNQARELGRPQDEMFGRFRDFTVALHQSGALKGFERLKAGTEGKTLRSGNGGIEVGGPYGGHDGNGSNGSAESQDHESVIGFYVVEAADEAAAHAIAKECPILLIGGSVEVRETEFFPGQ
ncbi:MAG TPA: YciI family protein [Thermoanaerobaculia bacterium]|jgi:hypothetical protein|nr:YciI family protein [Thermoanaerobaculia bacterium]